MRYLHYAAPSMFIMGSVMTQDTIPEQKPQKEKKSSKDKLFYGGSVGLSFGNYSRVALYPYVGYRITKTFRAAVQLGYE